MLSWGELEMLTPVLVLTRLTRTIYWGELEVVLTRLTRTEPMTGSVSPTWLGLGLGLGC